MQNHDRSEWQHSHDFSVINEKGEKRTWQVLVLTAVTMIVEIAAGTVFGSMSLLADGWHMGTHVAAFMITIFAYHYARKHADSPEFTFGTGKVSVLGGFASAVALAVVALMMLAESIHRILRPQAISFNEAIGVAVAGLLINLISALLLQDHHDHNHDHDAHAADDHGHDHNLRAAYMHVLADALTSVLAITALIAGKYLGWRQLDPVMGVVGAAVITRWSYILIRETSPLLLDASIDRNYRAAIRKTIENEPDNDITDIHVWRVGPADYAAIISIITHSPRNAVHYKKILAEFKQLSHITVEINRCTDASCIDSGRRTG